MVKQKSNNYLKRNYSSKCAKGHFPYKQDAEIATFYVKFDGYYTRANKQTKIRTV